MKMLFLSMSPLWRRLFTWLVCVVVSSLITWVSLTLFDSALASVAFLSAGIGLLISVQMSLNSAILLICSSKPSSPAKSLVKRAVSPRLSALRYTLLWLLIAMLPPMLMLQQIVARNARFDSTGVALALTLGALLVWLGLSLFIGLLGASVLVTHNKQRH